MSIFYKLKSEKEFKRLNFGDFFISVEDVKREILIKNRLGKLNDFYIQLMDADTNKVYADDKMLISSNSSVLYGRIPVAVKKQGPKTLIDKNATVTTDKIDAIINRNPTNNNSKKNQTAPINRMMPANYVCRKCYIPGHWINDCPLGKDRMPIKKSSGIPRTFMETVNGPEVEGAMYMSNGTYGRRRNNFGHV
ncbi:PREDICTED: uncharacterized RING finger protein P8B7.15c-like, partial [Nicrophorus vespilloides]|uniref:Uncharacterized RING finger protein P8B7.15c-like n=1 Tax=Nicrophorus vespilloides TaxID=110193 RepID=A0ABM1N3B4_NICVS